MEYLYRKGMAIHAGLACVAVIALSVAGCGGGSSDSSDDPESGGGFGGGLSGDVTGASELFFFTVGDNLAETKNLVAVDPDNPGNGLVVAEGITHNYYASNETSAAGSPSNHRPNVRNLPRGVIAADLGTEGMNGPLSNVHHPWVVYNKPDGHLYRVGAEGDNPVPEQVSNEGSAGVICGAAIIPHYEEPEETLVLYQLPALDSEGDEDCGETTWKMTTVGASSNDAPVTLFGDPVPGGSIIPIHDWATGEPEGIIAHVDPDDSGTEDVIRFFTDGNSETLESGVNRFHTVERVGEDGIHLFNKDGTLVSYDPQPAPDHELVVAGGFSDIDQGIGAQHAARIKNEIVIVDNVEDRIVRYDPATNDVTAVATDLAGLEHSNYLRVVSVDDDVIAWVHTMPEDSADFTNNNNIARLASYDIGTNAHLDQIVLLDQPGTTLFPSAQLNRTFSVTSEQAPEGVVFYNDFDANHPVGVGDSVAVNITTGNEVARIKNSEWWGYTWSEDIQVPGREVERVLYVDASNINDLVFRSRDAANPQLSTEQSFATPDDLERIDFSSYGSRTLSGMISSSQDQSRVMLFMDLESGTLRRLTDGFHGVARPVPFY